MLLRLLTILLISCFLVACGGSSDSSEINELDDTQVQQDSDSNTTTDTDTTDSSGDETSNEDNEADSQTSDSSNDTAADTSDVTSADTTQPLAQQWFRSYGGSGEESHGHYILNTSDGGYLQIGETGYAMETNSTAKIFAVKVNGDGVIQWKKEFGTRGHNLGNSAIEVADGYLIAGALNYKSALIKVNKNDGATVFSRTYDLSGVNAIEHLIDIESGYVLVGYTDALDRGNTFYTEGKGLLMTVDTQGAESQQLPSIDLNQFMSHGYRIERYQDHLYVAGLTLGAEDYALIKLEQQNLSLVWSNIYGGGQPDHMFAMDVSVDGHVYLSGHTLSNTQNWDTYTVKIDPSGSLVWQKTVGNPRGYDPLYIHDEAWGLIATDDGGVMVAAGTGDEYEQYSVCQSPPLDCSDTWQVLVVKLSSQGLLEWQATYGSPEGGDWAGEDIALAPDGTAVIAVDNGGFGFLKLTQQ